MKRNPKILVFTGNRSEYGLLKHVIKLIKSNLYLDLKLFVSASHISKKFGNTISEIKKDKIEIDKLISTSLDKSPVPSTTTLTAEIINEMGKALEEFKPNICILLGDRYETVGAALACHLNKIPIAHLHGGETTLGAIDDKLRHAISQLSTWHFTAADQYRKRVIEMGHDHKKVFMVGPLAIDGIANMKNINRIEFSSKTGYKFSSKNVIVTYHPETLLKNNGIEGFSELLIALENFDGNILFTHPNADEGRDKILEMINQFSNLNPEKTFVFPSLGQDLYLSALSLFEGVIGNSSSGIIEAPIIGIPVLNIGDRQKGRLRYGRVLDVRPNSIQITKGIKEILSWKEANIWPRKLETTNKLPSDFIVSWLLKQNL